MHYYFLTLGTMKLVKALLPWICFGYLLSSCANIDSFSDNDHLAVNSKVDTVPIFKKAEGGMLYNIHLDKQGITIKEGDFVAFKAIEKTEGDSVLYSSYDYDRPSLLVKEKSVFKGDLFAALGLLSEGDSATFKINIDSMVQKMGRPQPSDSTKTHLVYIIKIDKVIPKGSLNDSLFQGKIDEFLKAEMEQAKTAEVAKVKAYVSSKSLKPKVTSSGLNYVVSKEGTGAKPNPGDTVVVNYTGSFLSGKIFDTSLPDIAKKAGTFNPQRPYKPLKLPVGLGGSIPGFEEGVMLLNKGGKATLIMPSKLAYGEEGNQGIPPLTPLVFEVDIVEIRRKLN